MMEAEVTVSKMNEKWSPADDRRAYKVRRKVNHQQQRAT
jgi:hypothetical protein